MKLYWFKRDPGESFEGKNFERGLESANLD